MEWGEKPLCQDGPCTWTWDNDNCEVPDTTSFASSTLLSKEVGRYALQNVSDDDPITAWNEGEEFVG